LMDSGRNCISNIRKAGLSFEAAAAHIFDLVGLAFAHNVTGVRLNDLRSVARQAGIAARIQG
jgi:ethanolamine ammonia-lyase small subunit